MKLKTVSWIILIIGILTLLWSVAAPILFMLLMSGAPDRATIGIIGGADLPTIQFLSNQLFLSVWMRSPGFRLFLLGIALIIAGIICLIVAKRSEKKE